MPIRELIFVLVGISLTCVAPFKPRIGLYGYIWISVAQPDVIAWCIHKYPFSMLLAAGTLIGCLRYVGSVGVLFRIPMVWILLLMQIPLALSVIFSPETFLSMDRYETYLRVMIMALAIPLLMESVQHMKELMLTLVITEAFLGSRQGLFGLIQGGAVLNQVYGDGIYDNNVLALSIATLIPICWYFYTMLPPKKTRLLVLIIIVTAVPAVIMTGSRGASLAFGAILFCMIFYSKRRTAFLVLVMLALGPAIYLMKDVYFSRMQTIAHYQDEASASSRVEFWQAAIEMWQDYPLLGVGFGQRNFSAMVPKYTGKNDRHVVHNTYLQMLVDSGIFAFLLYCLLLIVTIVWLGKSIRETRWSGSGVEAIPMALQVAIIGMTLGSTFYSLQLFDYLYMLLMTGAAWYRVSKFGELATAGSNEGEESGEIFEADLQVEAQS